MREHEVNKLNNFIMGWYNNTDFCDELVNYWYNDDNKESGVVSTKDGDIGIDKSIKDSVDSYLGPGNPLFEKYTNKYLRTPTDNYIDRYKHCNVGSPWTVLQGIQVQRYAPGGGFYQWHTERNSDVPVLHSTRHLVFMTYLNTVTDGGETEFYYQNVKIKPEKGLTLIWPADWTFTHRGVTSLTQEKFVVTGWFNYYTPEENYENISTRQWRMPTTR